MRAIFEVLFEDYIFDPSIIDLVLWFPHLSWGQFITATVSVLTWSWLSERLWRIAIKALRNRILAYLLPGLQNLTVFGIRIGRLLAMITR